MCRVFAPILANGSNSVGTLMIRPELSIKQILVWADAYRRRWNEWPHKDTGRIRESANDDTWMAVEMAMRCGGRGLPRGLTIPRLLAQHRGVRNRKALPRFTLRQILIWADEHHKRTKMWPYTNSGPILGTHGEWWDAVDRSLRNGNRGLPGGDSIARLLSRARGVGLHRRLPPLTIKAIVTWAKAHHRRTGRWPTQKSGSIPEANGTTWQAVELALRRGYRGLPGDSSLSRVLRA
jgi:hypothetical protein